MHGESKLVVTVASGPYAHLAALADGNDADGIELQYEVLEPPQILTRMHRDAAWDIAEMSLATIYMLADRRDPNFAPLPVFPSREFRHSALYVPADGSVCSARDLRGATIGVLRYAMTTAVWVRALLTGQYGVPPEGMQWVVGDESPHPAWVNPRIVDGAAVLERMAVAGELDCLVSGRTPASFLNGKLRRLFAEFGAEERAYFASTGIFPIMHVMAARRSLVEQRPEVVPILIRRFESAKLRAEEGLRDFDVSTYPVPWLAAHIDDARRQMGSELWPYGVEANRTTLVAFGQLLAAEGLTTRALAPEEVFTVS